MELNVVFILILIPLFFVLVQRELSANKCNCKIN